MATDSPGRVPMEVRRLRDYNKKGLTESVTVESRLRNKKKLPSEQIPTNQNND